MSPRRLSQIFHNNAPASACPINEPDNKEPGSSTTSPSPVKPTTPPAKPLTPPVVGTKEKTVVVSSKDASPEPADPVKRGNLRDLVEQIVAELEDNPSCEGLRRKFSKSTAPHSNPVIHTIGSCLPTPLHDFLKDIIDRIHKYTRRDASTKSVGAAVTDPANPSAPASGQANQTRVSPTASAPPQVPAALCPTGN